VMTCDLVIAALQTEMRWQEHVKDDN